MLLSVGLTERDLSTLDHRSLTISCSSEFRIYEENPEVTGFDRNVVVALSCKPRSVYKMIPAGKLLAIDYKDQDTLEISIDGGPCQRVAAAAVLVLKPSIDASTFTVSSINRSGAPAVYKGSLVIFSRLQKDSLRIALVLDLDEYLKGVLQSEIPASYHVEAIKSQAVAARTYGLNPRVNHANDFIHVCDSYSCCQYFLGLDESSSPRHDQAIHETAGLVLTYNGEPALTLFSSNAGGHTEYFENCFSDPVTKQFPPKPLPYLRGVPETTEKVPIFDESLLRRLHAGAPPHTVDAWSPHFKWQVDLSAEEIECDIHATVQKLLADPERAPFVVAPPSGEFGLVDSFDVVSRGPSGCAIDLVVKTSDGNWLFKKELVIRDLFGVATKKLARLKSARLFFDHSRDSSKRLTGVTINGLGWGHGVGLQQTGAQGWARSGRDYRWILDHYFADLKMEKL